MDQTIFVKLNEQLSIALANEKISKEFLSACEKGIEEFSRLKEKSKKYQEILPSLKLFSATNSGKLVLESCVSALKNAKELGENPKTLGELSGIINEICNLGEEVKIAIEQHDVNRRLGSIRKRTFRVQEKAEENGLIKSIDVRLNEVPAKIRKAFVEYSMPPLESS